jgi:hypothetical protein
MQARDADDLSGTVEGGTAEDVRAQGSPTSHLGFMNEMARFAEYAIADAGGLGRCDIAGLNREQRRMLPNRDGRYATPPTWCASARNSRKPSYSKLGLKLVIWNTLASCGLRRWKRTASRCCPSTASMYG